MYALAWYDWAYCQFKQHNFAQALDGFSRYLSAQAGTDKRMVADAYARTGDCYYYARRYGRCRKVLRSGAADLSGQRRLCPLPEGVHGRLAERPGTPRSSCSTSSSPSIPVRPICPMPGLKRDRPTRYSTANNEAIASYRQLMANYPQSAIARKGGLQPGHGLLQ